MDPREARVLEAARRGDAHEAADVCFRAYGAELHGWLVALYGRPEAEEIYGNFAEALCHAMAGFRGDASARTFSYAVARNVARRHLRDRARKRQLLTPLSHHPSALDRAGDTPEPAAPVELLEELALADRELVILRVDRGFSFREIACLRLGTGAGGTALVREEARLRKRFQLVRDRLRARSAPAP